MNICEIQYHNVWFTLEWKKLSGLDDLSLVKSRINIQLASLDTTIHHPFTSFLVKFGAGTNDGLQIRTDHTLLQKKYQRNLSNSEHHHEKRHEKLLYKPHWHFVRNITIVIWALFINLATKTDPAPAFGPDPQHLHSFELLSFSLSSLLLRPASWNLWISPWMMKQMDFTLKKIWNDGI